MWSGLCDVAAVGIVAWMLWFALAGVQSWLRLPEPFLTSPPKDGSPPGERRGYLYPLSILVLTRFF